MLKSKWAHAEEEAPTTAPVKQEAASAAPAPPAVNVTYDATYADASLDSFAQTAGTDDLFFDDDMTPISQPVVEQSSTLGAEAPEFVPAPEQPPPTAAPPHHQHQQQQQQQQHAPRAPREPRNTERGGRGRGRGRGEGRGRGRGGRGRGGPVGDIRLEEQAAKEELSRDTPAAAPAAASVEPSSAPAATNEPPADAPTGPSTPSTASVRGDRTLTGGSKRTRLTEAELSAKLASMRSKNEALASAHARAQADAAAAEAREQQLKQQEVERKKAAAEKQKAERKDRQQLMGERERNRQRKLNAQGGREWDLEKEEGFDGTGEERRRGAARGAYGGVAGVPRGAAEGGRELFDEGDGGEAASYRGGRGGRGRGGRGGRGGGGGGGRGDLHDRHDGRGASKHTPQPPPAKEDFPSLPPSSSAPSAPSPPGPRIQEFSIKGKGDNTPSAPKNQDIRKHDPELKRELDLPAEPKPKTAEEKVAPRPEVKKMESFGLEPLPKGQSWADDE